MRSPEAIVTTAHQRAFGNTGLRVPPIVFDAGVLGNARSVLPEQTRFEIVGEWLRCVAPPVMIHVEGQGGAADVPLSFLARALRRYEVPAEDAIINVNIPMHGSTGEVNGDAESILRYWRMACTALGSAYRPRLAAVELPAEDLDVAGLRAPVALRVASDVAGVGIVLRARTDTNGIAVAIAGGFEWLFCTSGPSLVDSPPELPGTASLPSEHGLPIIAANVFAGDFLLGGNRYNERTLNPLDDSDRALLAWRKSFVALCHGHGITPAHACVQFALGQPAVVAVVMETPYPDFVAENARHAVTPVPQSFWDALREEGLIGRERP